ncbi:unnamed protein product [Allacma fusca]|uniref:Uncharacterized protein n=1 Tax=Allacma fusca TaxID=39272 RepID=A0A8J2JLQ3_9HEXA|nr:unnamed protein product [Allacma fusca]
MKITFAICFVLMCACVAMAVAEHVPGEFAETLSDIPSDEIVLPNGREGRFYWGHHHRYRHQHHHHHHRFGWW